MSNPVLVTRDRIAVELAKAAEHLALAAMYALDLPDFKDANQTRRFADALYVSALKGALEIREGA